MKNRVKTSRALADLVSNLDPSQLAGLRELLNLAQPSSAAPKSHAVTFDAFVKEALENMSSTLSASTVKDYKIILRKFRAFIGEDRSLKHITVRDAENFQVYLLKQGVKKTSVNEYMASLASLFEMAVRRRHLKDNPFRRVKKLKYQKAPLVTMSPEEVRTFLGLLPKFWKNFFSFSYLTGCRVSEVVSLRWEDLDFDQKTIRIGSKFFETKTRKTRVIPMNVELYTPLLEMKNASRSKYVFAKSNSGNYTGTYVSSVFKRWVRKLGFNPEIVLHSLRHSYATHLIQAGVSLYHVKELLGHSSIQTTERYVHACSETLHDEVNLLRIGTSSIDSSGKCESASDLTLSKVQIFQ
jgi:site-specific recombinase XerD